PTRCSPNSWATSSSRAASSSRRTPSTPRWMCKVGARASRPALFLLHDKIGGPEGPRSNLSLAACVVVVSNLRIGRRVWHQRGYLPHLDGYGIVQHIVFRLHDSVPADATDSGDDVLDKGHGSSVLSDAPHAQIVAQALLHHDGQRYTLHA